jgi:hypothetical protein
MAAFSDLLASSLTPLCVVKDSCPGVSDGLFIVHVHASTSAAQGALTVALGSSPATW